MNDSRPSGSLLDEAQPVDIIIDYIGRKTMTVVASASNLDD